MRGNKIAPLRHTCLALHSVVMPKGCNFIAHLHWHLSSNSLLHYFSILAHCGSVEAANNADETITLHYFAGDGAETNSLALYDEHNIIYPDPNISDNNTSKFFFFISHFGHTRSTSHSGPEKLKNSRPKKLMKSNKSISRKKFFEQFPFFAISKMAKNQFLNWEKV